MEVRPMSDFDLPSGGLAAAGDGARGTIAGRAVGVVCFVSVVAYLGDTIRRGERIGGDLGTLSALVIVVSTTVGAYVLWSGSLPFFHSPYRGLYGPTRRYLLRGTTARVMALLFLAPLAGTVACYAMLGEAPRGLGFAIGVPVTFAFWAAKRYTRMVSGPDEA
jgi:hypothetical protein